MTGAEAILWRALRGSAFMGMKFRRQVPIGKYIVDFVCIEHRLIVEMDGAPHDDPRQKQYDDQRL
jgi:very-short-patch-repair endonuclease